MLKVYVGDGFREVLPNEPLLEGDQYWSESFDRWLPSHNARSNYPRTKGVYYRRRIGADAFSVPAGHSLQPYLKFIAAERLDSGDLVVADASGKLSKYRTPSPPETSSGKTIWGKA